jgi:hypothetical protein
MEQLRQHRACLVTQANDAFVPYAAVLLWSIRKQNPLLQCDCVILTHPTLSPLSTENRMLLASIWPGIHFHDADDAPYRVFASRTPERLHPALLKLELFKMTSYETLVFIDADILCLGDITELFEIDVPFAGVLAGKNRERKEQLAGRRCFRLGVNSGVMVLGSKYRDHRVYERLLKSRMASCPTADQDIINRFLRFRRTYCLDHRFNYHAQFFWHGSETDVRLLHYAGPKPLDVPGEPRMRPWLKAFQTMQQDHNLEYADGTLLTR